LGDILTLQSQVASAIVNQVRISLTPEEQQQLASTRPVSAGSYENYLKGRYYWNKRSEEGLNKAIEYFQLATEKDPHYALAFADWPIATASSGRQLLALFLHAK